MWHLMSKAAKLTDAAGRLMVTTGGGGEGRKGLSGGQETQTLGYKMSPRDVMNSVVNDYITTNNVMTIENNAALIYGSC